MKRIIRNLILHLVAWSERHYITATLLLTLPSIWFVILTWFGKKFGLKSDDGALTFEASVTSFICVIFLIIIPIIQKVIDKSEKRRIADELASTQNSITVCETLLRSSANIVRIKAQRYIDLLSSSKIDINSSIKPVEQMNEILKEIEIILAEIFGVNRNDIEICLFYAFYRKGKADGQWDILASKNISPVADIDFILSNPNSSLRQIIDEKTTFLFYADKNEAVENNQYVYENEEANGECYGSIWLKLIEISRKRNRNGRESLKAVLCISTKKQQLLDKNSDNYDHMQKILNETILEPYLERIKLELVLFYLQYIQEQKAKKTTV